MARQHSDCRQPQCKMPHIEIRLQGKGISRGERMKISYCLKRGNRLHKNKLPNTRTQIHTHVRACAPRTICRTDLILV